MKLRKNCQDNIFTIQYLAITYRIAYVCYIMVLSYSVLVQRYSNYMILSNICYVDDCIHTAIHDYVMEDVIILFSVLFQLLQSNQAQIRNFE